MKTSSLTAAVSGLGLALALHCGTALRVGLLTGVGEGEPREPDSAVAAPVAEPLETGVDQDPGGPGIEVRPGARPWTPPAAAGGCSPTARPTAGHRYVYLLYCSLLC